MGRDSPFAENVERFTPAKQNGKIPQHLATNPTDSPKSEKNRAASLGETLQEALAMHCRLILKYAILMLVFSSCLAYAQLV